MAVSISATMPCPPCDKVTREDAIFSIGRVAWLVLALQSGNVNNLRSGCEDKIHQPQRSRQGSCKHVSRPRGPRLLGQRLRCPRAPSVLPCELEEV